MKPRARVGQAARRRRLSGGPRAIGRPAASISEWAIIRDLVLTRAGGRCEACGRCARLDVHHVLKRAQGGSDFDVNQLVALCRACHEQTDAPYAKGRLIVTRLGEGQFVFRVVQQASKWINRSAAELERHPWLRAGPAGATMADHTRPPS